MTSPHFGALIALYQIPSGRRVSGREGGLRRPDLERDPQREGRRPLGEPRRDPEDAPRLVGAPAVRPDEQRRGGA